MRAGPSGSHIGLAAGASCRRTTPSEPVRLTPGLSTGENCPLSELPDGSVLRKTVPILATLSLCAHGRRMIYLWFLKITLRKSDCFNYSPEIAL